MKPESWALLIALAAVVLLIGYSLSTEPFTRSANGTIQIINPQPTPAQQPAPPQPTEQVKEVRLLLPAITEERTGITNELRVWRVAGRGRAFIEASFASPIIANETQASLRNALTVARQFNDASNGAFQQSDLYYSFGNTALNVEGKSAGAAMTIAAIALLLDLKLNSSVAITGSIYPNGTIGPVGGVLEKATALRNAGYTLFIVPTGESIERSVEVNEVQECEEKKLRNGVFRVCTIKREANVTDSPVNSTGINVVEVGDIRQALELMVQYD